MALKRFRPAPFAALVCTCALAALLIAGGCDRGQHAQPQQATKTADLTGTWKNASRPSTQSSESTTGNMINDTWASLVLTLDADGKFHSTQSTLGASMTMAGTWTVSDHTLVLAVQETGGQVKLPEGASPVGKVIDLTVSDDATRLTLRRPNNGGEFAYERTR